MENIIWELKAFECLSLNELYQIMRVRQKVFVIEQTCLYEDLDEKDQLAFHLMGWRAGKLVAYARLLPKGLSYKEASIGRVLTVQSERGLGTGKALMTKAMSNIEDLFDEKNIRISAQAYLEPFYEALGFKPVSDIYIEDGIAHLEMLYTPQLT